MIGALAVALAVSLAMTAILALRVKDESDQQARLRAQVSQLRSEIETLRGRQPQDGATILERIAAAVEQIRGLTFRRDVHPEVLTDAQLAARVEETFREDSPQAEVDQTDGVLTALGLLAPRDDLYQILLAVQREQVAGFYDTKKKVLVVGGDAKNPTPLDRVLLAHEYVHALTDQIYDLGRLDVLNDARKEDEATAFLSLVEGDATVMQVRYLQRYLTAGEKVDVAREAAAAPLEKFEAAPRVIRESLIFPYLQGQKFVEAVLARGGIAALNGAYQDPPTSTEQILHPAKYLSRRDDPTPVAVPGLARTLGSGWRNLPSGGIGELDVRLIVDEFLSQSDAVQAADGWDGGRYAAASSEAGVVVGALTEWDSQTEAREAASILGRWLPARYGNRGSDVPIEGGVGRGWDAPGGAGLVIRAGTRVLLVVGPDRASVERARSAFSGF